MSTGNDLSIYLSFILQSQLTLYVCKKSNTGKLRPKKDNGGPDDELVRAEILDSGKIQARIIDNGRPTNIYLFYLINHHFLVLVYSDWLVDVHT